MILTSYPTAVAFSSIADAANAIGRLYGVFEAELLEKTHSVDRDIDSALEVKGASFTWDSPPPEEDQKKHKKGRMMQSSKSKAKAAAKAAAQKKRGEELDEKAKNEEDRVFKMNEINMTLPRGKLVAIVGSVGSGKTSLLQGLIGEMRKTSGSIVFGGSVGYCPQSAWIQVGVLQTFVNTVTKVCFYPIRRMPPFARISVLDVHSRKTGTGMLCAPHAWNLIWRCCPTVI